MVSNFLILYAAMGVLSVIGLIFILATERGFFEKEEPMAVILISFATFFVATLVLWPIFLPLMVMHKFQAYFHSARIKKLLKRLRDSWDQTSALADVFNDKLDQFLNEPEIDFAKELELRDAVNRFERAYDRWRKFKSDISEIGQVSAPNAFDEFNDLHFVEPENWPTTKVVIHLEYDDQNNIKNVSHSTIRTVIPVPKAEPPVDNRSESILRSVLHSPHRPRTNPSIWSVSISPRFTRSVKKLQATEIKKLEGAIEDILLAPTETRGNTKAPLSNNLNGFWKYRCGDWRVIYLPDADSKTVTVMDYLHRSKAYA